MLTIFSRLAAAWPLVGKRSLSHWRLLSSVVIGVFLASAVMAGTVIYFDSLRELALDNTLDRLTRDEKNIVVKANRGPTNRVEYAKVAATINREIETHVDWLLVDRIRGGKSTTFFLTAPGAEAHAGQDNARSYFAFPSQTYGARHAAPGRAASFRRAVEPRSLHGGGDHPRRCRGAVRRRSR